MNLSNPMTYYCCFSTHSSSLVHWLLLLLACPLFLHNFVIYVLLSTLYTVVILFSPKWPAALLLLACVTTVSLLFAVVLHWICLPSTTSICSIQPIILYLFSLMLYYMLPIIQGKQWVLLAGYFLFVQVLLCLLSYLSISGCSYCYYCPPPLIGQLDHLVPLGVGIHVLHLGLVHIRWEVINLWKMIVKMLTHLHMMVKHLEC